MSNQTISLLSEYNSNLDSFDYNGELNYSSELKHKDFKITIIQNFVITQEQQLKQIIDLVDKISEIRTIDQNIVLIDNKLKVKIKMYSKIGTTYYSNHLYDIDKFAVLGLTKIHTYTYKTKDKHHFELVFKVGVQ